MDYQTPDDFHAELVVMRDGLHAMQDAVLPALRERGFSLEQANALASRIEFVAQIVEAAAVFVDRTFEMDVHQERLLDA